jgi:hypothetical protein
MSNMPEFKKGLNLHGDSVMGLLTRPKRTLIRGAKQGIGAIESQYDYSPKEMMSNLYAPSKQLYKSVSSKANRPRKSGKVLEATLKSLGMTGGRALWGGKF